MILKKITLNNIRSYKHQEINFPEGSTLLSGDIGSGKTSILLGIEFALFGLQPGQKGSSILRNGEKEGSVVMGFDVDGKNIVIERTLKRGKTITQDYCAITIDDEKREFSVTELKDKVLDLLAYPREFSKKQNLLYKFTVYTPQEEMKQIITEDPELRVNTLRHIFGVDKYKKILENTDILASKLREEKRTKEVLIENLEYDRANLVAKEDELETKYSNLASVEKELFLKSEARKLAQEEKDAVSEKIEKSKRLQQEIEKTKIVIRNKEDSLLTNSKVIEQTEAQIKEIAALKFEEAEIKKLEAESLFLKKEKEKLNEENVRITSEISSINLRNQEAENLTKRIKHIDTCPTCLQNVDPVYKSNVLNKIESDMVENKKRLEQLKTEKNSVINKISSLENNILSLEKQTQDLKILKIKISDAEEKKRRIAELAKTNEAIKKDIDFLNSHLEDLNKSVFELNKFENIFLDKQKELDKALKEERTAEIKVAELKKEIEVFSRNLEELRQRIKKAEEIREKLAYVSKLEDWLSEDFSSLISMIEKNVMIKLKGDFSRLFAQWFAMLVPDTFNVWLDDNFTPQIEYQDYEIDYQYLSGGERTAVALAYRLSLNQVVNSLMSKIKTRNLVILDEPTDGFSEQQLDKMRDVLRQLEVKQLIIVSHEQKIESFVENVIKFAKEGGISKIASESLI